MPAALQANRAAGDGPEAGRHAFVSPRVTGRTRAG
jgi:hypothetical protein